MHLLHKAFQSMWVSYIQGYFQWWDLVHFLWQLTVVHVTGLLIPPTRTSTLSGALVLLERQPSNTTLEQLVLIFICHAEWHIHMSYIVSFKCFTSYGWSHSPGTWPSEWVWGCPTDVSAMWHLPKEKIYYTREHINQSCDWAISKPQGIHWHYRWSLHESQQSCMHPH